ncbi:MAG TPA: RdgB/HAM1 family non-canonical purine NTP pyrophosphatase [Candidatus Xenobia bacterium]|nr:RdgB/HAM1 family non-canonical purine NTP pyrophosphatase [Candidatus Xenobia bacterium]
MRLFLASSNRGKLRELAGLAAAEGFQLESLRDYERLPKFPENEPSFALNALEKALHYSRMADGLVVADDSGLAVDALAGRPGVRSARYAGPQATDEDNNRKLLEELRGLPEEKRTARYVCVLALARRTRILAIFSAACEGRILEAPRGKGGFGYDPLFFFPPLGKAMAELEVAEKNRYSHRGQAFAKLLAYLKQHPPVL